MSNVAKFLMLFLIGIVIALVTLWLVGGKKKDFQARVTINGAPTVIFPYLVEFDQRKKWQSGLVDSRMITETERQVGARAMTTISTEEGNVDYDEEILRYQEGEFLSVRAEGPNEIATSIFRLEVQQDGATSLSYKIKTEPKGMSRMLAPFSNPDTQQQVDDEVLKLKRLVESENPSSSANQFNQDPTISAGNQSSQ